MFLPDSTPPATNGQSPQNMRTVLDSIAERQDMNAAVAAGYRAVYGKCTPPGSYSDSGINLMSDIAQSPSPGAVVAGMSNGSAFAHASDNDLTEPPVNSIPLNGAGYSGLPDPPQYPSLTTPQGSQVPRVPPNTQVPGRQSRTCPPDTMRVPVNLAVAPPGIAPAWGDSYAQLPPPQVGESGVVGWIQDHPGTSFVLFVFGLALLTNGGGNGR